MEKVYIVADKEQELRILGKLEHAGVRWSLEERPTLWVPSQELSGDLDFKFPYVLIKGDYLYWDSMENLGDGPLIYVGDSTVVYDGRKEGKTSKRYKVKQEFIEALNKWRDVRDVDTSINNSKTLIVPIDLSEMPAEVRNWCIKTPDVSAENNNRLIAIIQWLNGEDVFEVEKLNVRKVRVED